MLESVAKPEVISDRMKPAHTAGATTEPLEQNQSKLSAGKLFVCDCVPKHDRVSTNSELLI